MKPLVEAVVTDATGVMKATFFNQPWLKDQYKAGHAAHAGRQVPGRQPLPRQQPRAHRRGGRAARRPPRSTPRPRASPRRRSSPPCASTATPSPTWSSRCPRRCGSPSACPIAPAAIAAAHFGDREGGPRAAGLRRAARRPGRAAAPARRAPRHAGGRRRWPRSRRSRACGATRCCPSRPTGDQAAAMDEIDADLARRAPDAAPAHGRGRLGQDRRRPARHAARGRARHAGGADGARPRRSPSSTSRRSRRSCPARWSPSRC